MSLSTRSRRLRSSHATDSKLLYPGIKRAREYLQSGGGGDTPPLSQFFRTEQFKPASFHSSVAGERNADVTRRGSRFEMGKSCRESALQAHPVFSVRSRI